MSLPPSATSYLQENEDALSGIVDNSMGQMPEGMNPHEQEEFRARMLAQMQLGKEQMGTLFDINDAIFEATEEANQMMPTASSIIPYFNLLKEAQMTADPMMGQDPMMPQDPMAPATPMSDPMVDPLSEPMMGQESQDFESGFDLFNYLEEKLMDSKNIDATIMELTKMVDNDPTVSDDGVVGPNPKQVIKDSIQEYLDAMRTDNKQRRTELAMKMFEVMPQSDKGEAMITGVEHVVAESNEVLRRLAKSLAQYNKTKQASNKPFNLQKEAQHKGMENVIMHGPEGSRIDSVTGQLINDWHIYERNKGWGLKMEDSLFIDYEAVWRGTIMDKYSRPYRNSDGEYVGGYIEKRFEVDKWMPPTNSYQLKPGERRRNYLPEFRSTEARMQHMRANSSDSDVEYCDTSEPFNWAKEAKAKKQIKTAQLSDEIEPKIVYIIQDLNSGKELQKIDAKDKIEATQIATNMSKKYGQPVLLLTYDMAVDEMSPFEEDIIGMNGSSESVLDVAASVDSKKKIQK